MVPTLEPGRAWTRLRVFFIWTRITEIFKTGAGHLLCACLLSMADFAKELELEEGQVVQMAMNMRMHGYFEGTCGCKKRRTHPASPFSASFLASQCAPSNSTPVPPDSEHAHHPRAAQASPESVMMKTCSARTCLRGRAGPICSTPGSSTRTLRLPVPKRGC